MTIDELIVALEQATGPIRELDDAIAEYAGIRVVDEGHPFGVVWYSAERVEISRIRYTASIDAALTLVPEGWTWVLQASGHSRLANVYNDKTVDGIAETPTIALCLAALKARQS